MTEACHRKIGFFCAVIFLLFVLISMGCERKTAQIPMLTLSSCNCHDYSQITKPVSDENSGLLEWMLSSSRGLIRTQLFIPRPLDNLTIEWFNRGRHNENGQYCDGCHALEDGVIKHTLSFYPENARSNLYKPGKNCAETCHEWLKNDITTGSTYTGSFRPEDLLKDSNAHSRIYNEGFRGDPGDNRIKIFYLPPGCGGCHNFNTTRHGWVPTCLDCHSFIYTSATGATQDTSLHVMHKGLSMDACSYCHATGSAPGERGRAVCYNCHLSGHMPRKVF